MKEWITMTSGEIDQLDRNLPVIIPLGLVEAHGPHLPVSVDVESALYFSRICAEKTGAILAPIITYGFADEMREYPGSLGVRLETFMHVITDISSMFCFQGFKKLIFITGHGANKAPCELAFYKVWEKYPDFRGVCWNWWSDCGITHIHHADKGETEVAMAIGIPTYMDRVRDFELKKPWYKIRSRYELDKQSGGINGKPSQSKVEEGQQMVDKAVSELTKKIMQAINDKQS